MPLQEHLKKNMTAQERLTAMGRAVQMQKDRERAQQKQQEMTQLAQQVKPAAGRASLAVQHALPAAQKLNEPVDLISLLKPNRRDTDGQLEQLKQQEAALMGDLDKASARLTGILRAGSYGTAQEKVVRAQRDDYSAQLERVRGELAKRRETEYYRDLDQTLSQSGIIKFAHDYDRSIARARSAGAEGIPSKPMYEALRGVAQTLKLETGDPELAARYGSRFKVRHMTGDEKNTVLYYIGRGEYDKGREYLEALERTLNERSNGGVQERVAQWAQEHPVQGALTNITGWPLNIPAYFDNAGRVIKNAVTGEYEPADPNRDAYVGARIVSGTGKGVQEAARESAVQAFGSEQAGEVAAFLAGTGLSIGQNATQIAALGPYSLAGMTISAAGAATTEALDRGATPEQAFLVGTAGGAVEAVTEKLPLDNLFRIAREGGGQGAKQVVKNILKQAGTEATEEMLSEIAGNLVDTAVMQDKSEYRQYVRELENGGMRGDEAEKQAFLQFCVANTLMAGAGGALSGVAMSGGATVFAEAGRYVDALRGKKAGMPTQAAEERGIESASGIFQTALEGKAKGGYRETRPTNVELPSAPIINLSMQTVADMNGGVLPETGNSLRDTAVGRARTRLGLTDGNSAAYIPASNVKRNGEEYILKITPTSLRKMLSPSNDGIVPIESIAVMENIERVANNGVYYASEGDRQGRDQIPGYDRLKSTVYIDNEPYAVDMRIRLLKQTVNNETENVLYYFTPEEVMSVKKVGADLRTGKRPALTVIREMAPTGVRVTQPGTEVNPQNQKPIDLIELLKKGERYSAEEAAREQEAAARAQAAANRLAVQQAQTKLGADTARQIEDLRAQGEFDKAEASLRQWQAEYDAAMYKFRAENQLTYDRLTQGQKQLASLGQAMLEAGLMPTSGQLAAMGMTQAQASAALMTAQLERASGGMNEAHFRQMAQGMAASLSQGATSATVSGIKKSLDKSWAKMNKTQKSQIQNLLNRYGVSYPG